MLSSQTDISAPASIAAKSAILDRKIEECTADLLRSVTQQLFSNSKDNAATIVKYFDALKSEVNPAPNCEISYLAIESQKAAGDPTNE
jgi:hypothetical protein